MDDTQNKKQFIHEESCTAKRLLSMLQEGNNVFDNILEESEIETRIMQLLHLRQYALMYKFAFEDWETSNNEQSYIEMGNSAKDLHNIVESDVYKKTLTRLICMQKHITNESIEMLHETYLIKMGVIWKEAGLIQCLRKRDA